MATVNAMMQASEFTPHHPPRLTERYEVVGVLASGSSAVLYEVVDTESGEHLAAKLLLTVFADDPSARIRFEREARIARSLASPHIVRVLDIGWTRDPALPFLLMELLRGEDLSDHIAKSGPLEPTTVSRIVAQLTAALRVTFAAGVVHRDLKPENVFLCCEGAQLRVVLVDFGIARAIHLSAGQGTHSILGTPLYIAPEQVHWKREDVTPRADLYALALVVYAMFVGEAYFAEEHADADSTLHFYLDVVKGIPELPSARAKRRRNIELPPGFDGWFAKATATAPEDRFDSPDAFEHTFQEMLRVSVEARPAVPAPARSTVRRLVPWMALPAALAVVGFFARSSVPPTPAFSNGTQPLAPLTPTIVASPARTVVGPEASASGAPVEPSPPPHSTSAPTASASASTIRLNPSPTRIREPIVLER